MGQFDVGIWSLTDIKTQARNKSVKNNSLILNTFYRNNLLWALDYYFHLAVTLSFSKKISLTDCTMPAMSKIQIFKKNHKFRQKIRQTTAVYIRYCSASNLCVTQTHNKLVQSRCFGFASTFVGYVLQVWTKAIHPKCIINTQMNFIFMLFWGMIGCHCNTANAFYLSFFYG